jgi:hypothetical protein
MIKFKKILLSYLMIFLSTSFIFFGAGGDSSPVAILKSFSGPNITIKYNNQTFEPKNYLNLYINTEMSIDKNSSVTIIFKNGEKISLNEKLSFKVKEDTLEALNNETEKYFNTASMTLVYTKKDTLSSRGTKDNSDDRISDDVKKEIEEIEKNINDPMLAALAKAECYKANGLNKHAREEFKKHLNLLKQK